LGAGPRDVIRLMHRDACRLILISAAGGLVLALGLSRVLAASGFKFSAGDPLILLTPTAILVIIGLLASYLPARSATLVEPSVALRYE
jgi:ABC-type antimicrobial peptide transport system permease subunit